jgi:hypothetical protein
MWTKILAFLKGLWIKAKPAIVAEACKQVDKYEPVIKAKMYELKAKAAAFDPEVETANLLNEIKAYIVRQL